MQRFTNKAPDAAYKDRIENYNNSMKRASSLSVLNNHLSDQHPSGAGVAVSLRGRTASSEQLRRLQDPS